MYPESKKEVFALLINLLLHNETNCELAEIISFEKSSHEGSFPALIIRCKLKSGEAKTLRLKYSTTDLENSPARGGIEYEAYVYDNILNDITLSKPNFYGYIKNRNTDFLLIEYLENGTLIKHTTPSAFAQAATWIALFHKHFEGGKFPFVKRYDRDYFEGWSDKIKAVSRTNKKLDWLSNLGKFYRENIHILLEGPETIIHGEYYGKNILLCDDVIYPIDWEACAIGPPEIDLAALLDGKDEERIQLARNSYFSTKYPDGEPEVFEKKLALAELYFKFRWITEWVQNEEEMLLWLTNERFHRTLYNFAKKYNCI